MANHTPTTAEVRERFIDGFPIDTWATSRDECGQDFYRWLAEVERAAAEKAWDEGYQEANSDLWREGGREGNPYRAAEIREKGEQ